MYGISTLTVNKVVAFLPSGLTLRKCAQLGPQYCTKYGVILNSCCVTEKKKKETVSCYTIQQTKFEIKIKYTEISVGLF